MRLIQVDNKIHIANTGFTTFCGGKNGRNVDITLDAIAKNRSGHEYGKFLIKKGTCKECKAKARKQVMRTGWFSKTYRQQLFEEIFEPVPTSRPLPKKGSIGGVNKMMSNIRERLRRQSQAWAARKMLYTLKGPISPRFVTWDEQEHQAFLIGVNFAINEIFNDFKLEKYDRFRDGVYRELHEIVTGEELPTEKDERNE